MSRRLKKNPSIIKAVKKALEKDHQLLAELVVAEKLNKTLVELREQITEEELTLWMLYFELKRDKEDEAIEKAKRKARRR
jgi:hypothetical protein